MEKRWYYPFFTVLFVILFGGSTCSGFFGLFQREPKIFNDLHTAIMYLGNDLLDMVRPIKSTVGSVEGDTVIIKAGREMRVRSGQYFEVYSKDDDRYLGLLKTVTVRAREAEAIIIEERFTISPHDLVEMMVGGKIAIVGFYHENTEEEELSRTLHNEMISFFLRQTFFDVIERHQLEQHLEELKLSYTGLLVEGSPEVGRILGTDLILLGSISVVEDIYLLNATINETETGRMIATSSVRLSQEMEISPPPTIPSQRPIGPLGNIHVQGGMLASTLALPEHFSYFEGINSQIDAIHKRYDHETYEKQLLYIEKPGVAWGGFLELGYDVTDQIGLGALYEYLYCKEGGGYVVSEKGEVFLEETLDYRFHLKGVVAKIYRRMEDFGVFYGGLGYYNGQITFEQTYLDRIEKDSWIDKGGTLLQPSLGLLLGFSLTPQLTPSLGADLGFSFRFLNMSLEDTQYLGSTIPIESFSGIQLKLALTYSF